MNIILVNKEAVMRKALECDFIEEPQYLLNTYKQQLATNQIKLIEEYISLMENDYDDNFLDSKKQENMLDEIYSYFGITGRDWELLDV